MAPRLLVSAAVPVGVPVAPLPAATVIVTAAEEPAAMVVGLMDKVGIAGTFKASTTALSGLR